MFYSVEVLHSSWLKLLNEAFNVNLKSYAILF